MRYVTAVQSLLPWLSVMVSWLCRSPPLARFGGHPAGLSAASRTANGIGSNKARHPLGMTLTVGLPLLAAYQNCDICGVQL